MKKTALFSCVFALTCVMFLLPSINAQAAKTVKLASVCPLSGSFKDVGERYLEGVQYAAEVINEQGGLLGQKIEVIAVDSELKPDVATRKATKLILKDDVKFFSCDVGSSVGGAMIKLAEKHNLIVYTSSQAAASLTGENCSRNFFRCDKNTDTHSFALANYIAKKGYKKVAVIAQDYSFGQQAAEAFVRKLNELDPSAKIVVNILHPIGTKDFAPYVSQIISSGAEVVFTSNWGNDLTLLLKQGLSLGLDAKFVCYYLNDENIVTGVANDDAVVGHMASETYMLSIPTEENIKFKESFYKKKGYYPSYARGKAYCSTMFWAEAVKKAGSFDVDKIIEAWEGLTFDGPAGPWYMRPCDHQGQIPIWMAEMVKETPYYDHAYVGPAWMIPAKDISVPCEETGCNKIK
jgi:branched-chain amino acid transport system substrate-binding protein